MTNRKSCIGYNFSYDNSVVLKTVKVPHNISEMVQDRDVVITDCSWEVMWPVK